MTNKWAALVIVIIGLAIPYRAISQCDIFHTTGNQFDLLGDSVGVHGNWLVYTQRQRVHVMHWSGAAWTQHTELYFPNTVRAVDVYGDVIVAGVLGDLSIHVFRFNGSTWHPEATIHDRWSPAPERGRTLDLCGDVLVTCDFLNVGAWVYRYVGGEWVQEFENPYRWEAVATDGTRFVVGNQTSFWIYQYVGGQWVEEHSFPVNDYGAEHVDISGNLLVTSQPPSPDGWLTGGAEIYRVCDGQLEPWCLEHTIAFNTSDAALLGGVLAMARNHRIELYRDDAGAWNGIDVFSASSANDSFGSIVEMDSDWIVVGAPQDNSNSEDSGSVYVFRRDATYVATQLSAFELGTCLFPHDSIQEGLAAASPGGIVVIASGAYDEAPLVLDTPIVLMASGDAAIIE